MKHTLYRLQIEPRTAFGSPLKGDMLFGQLCWALREHCGSAALTDALNGYTAGLPFAVLSDAFPAGYLPKPVLPPSWLPEITPDQRKATKRKQWLALAGTHRPMLEWWQAAEAVDWQRTESGSHNTINRRTGTTGEGQFAPYSVPQHWYGRRSAPAALLDIYASIDERRISADLLRQLISAIGAQGFGRDASNGLGKFDLKSAELYTFAEPTPANAWLTLAPCVPGPAGWLGHACFYQVFVRFGRHGNLAATGDNPFKNPVLLAQTGALLTPESWHTPTFIGHGLGGNGELSLSMPQTVHQGYAPVVAVQIPLLAQRHSPIQEPAA